MKFQLALLAVRDVGRSRRFYEELFGQKVVEDYGENVVFDGGFAIQEKFEWLTGVSQDAILEKSNNMELYFETADFEGFLKRLKAFPDIEYVHPPKQHDWRQWVVRIYDPDFHIIEIGESMEIVVLRCLEEGNSPEETSRITQHSLDFVKSCMEKCK